MKNSSHRVKVFVEDESGATLPLSKDTKDKDYRYKMCYIDLRTREMRTIINQLHMQYKRAELRRAKKESERTE